MLREAKVRFEVDEDDVYRGSRNPYRIGFLSPSIFKRNSQEAFRYYRRENVFNLISPLYHYTSLAGFQGIIDSSGFWASDSRYLNDTQELAHGRELAASVVDHRMARLRLHSFRGVLKTVRDSLRRVPEEGRFIVCFSKARDSLEQWRGYGDGAGVCLRLKNMQGTPSHKPSDRPMFFFPDQVPYEVRYSWRSKVIALLSIIRRFESEYERDRRAMPRVWPDDHDENYVEYLLSTLEYAAVTFKNNAFQEEQEVRLVFRSSDVKSFNGGLQFRPSPFGLIPYISTGERVGMKGLLPISEVIIGPSRHQNLVAQSVDDFMRIKGYEGVAITLSKVPYRSS